MEDNIYRVMGPTRKTMRQLQRARKMARVAAAVAVVFALAVTTVTGWSAWNAAKDRSAATVPSFHTRYEGLGAQIVTNYLQGLPAPNVMIASDVKWVANAQARAAETDPEAFQKVGVPRNPDSVPSISGVTLDWGERYPLSLGASSKLPDMNSPDGRPLTEVFSDGTQEEVLRYYVIFNGQPVMVSLNLLTPPRSDYKTPPILLSAPSLSEPPRATMLGNSVKVSNSPVGTQGMLTFSANDGVKEALNRFAVAWAKNDQGTLKLLTKDTGPARYSGLGGWKSDGNVEIEWGARTSEMNEKDTAYVEATFTIKQDVVVEDEGYGSSSGSSKKKVKTYEMRQTMDFLIGLASTDAPSVLAWGPAGTWPDLEPGGNAIPEGEPVQNPGEGGDEGSSSDESGGASLEGSSGSSSGAATESETEATTDTESSDRSSTGTGSSLTTEGNTSGSPSQGGSLGPSAPPVDYGDSSGSEGTPDCERLGIC